MQSSYRAGERRDLLALSKMLPEVLTWMDKNPKYGVEFVKDESASLFIDFYSRTSVNGQPWSVQFFRSGALFRLLVSADAFRQELQLPPLLIACCYPPIHQTECLVFMKRRSSS